MSGFRELPIPDQVKADHRAVELLRVWAAQGSQQIALTSDAWEDPAAWGILLVDIARNVANAYVANEGCDFRAVLDRVKEGFDAEWNEPTD